jgi:hypothetical protein
MKSIRSTVTPAAILLLLSLAGCGSSEPVSDIANSEMVDINTTDVDPGTVGDASAVEAMGQGDVDMTGRPVAAPSTPKPSATVAEPESGNGQQAAVQDRGDKSAVAGGNTASAD